MAFDREGAQELPELGACAEGQAALEMVAAVLRIALTPSVNVTAAQYTAVITAGTAGTRIRVVPTSPGNSVARDSPRASRARRTVGRFEGAPHRGHLAELYRAVDHLRPDRRPRAGATGANTQRPEARALSTVAHDGS